MSAFAGKGELVFVITGAAALAGGIAALNLNVLRALMPLAQQRGMRLRVLSYFETDADRPAFLPAEVEFRGFRGNKSALVRALLREVTTRPTMCFDHVTIALPVLPFAKTGIIQTIIFAHGREAWQFVRRTSCWSFAAAKLVLANSHFTLEKMHARIPHFNGLACPLGLSPRFRLNDQIPTAVSERIELKAADGQPRALGRQMLLMVARMHPDEPRKGHLPLLKAWPLVAREFPGAQLVFAGQGENKPKLQQLARESGAGASIFLNGPVSVELLEQLYRKCFAFAMPSKQEGFGLVYLEAMNCGKPCVGCFDDGAQDVIVHGETGLLVRDPNDAGELSGVLGKLLRDPARAEAMGRKGFARLHENFTSRHVQERIAQHIGKALA